MFFFSIYYWDNLRYHASFALVFAVNIAVASSLVIALALILKIIRHLMNKYLAPKDIYRKVPVEPLLLQDADEPNHQIKKKKSKWVCSKGLCGITHTINVLAVILLTIAIFCLSVIPAAFYGLHLLSLAPTIIAIFTFYVFCFGLMVLRLSYAKKEKLDDPEDHPNTPDYSKRIKNLFRRNKILFFLIGCIAMLFTVGIPLAMRDSCICIFSQDFGISVLNASAVFSTRLIRSFTVPKVCPPGPPCHVYATLPSNTSSAVFINAHTDYDVEQVAVNYDLLDFYEANGYTRFNALSNSNQLDFEDNGKRTVHSTLLWGLEPATMYYYEIVYNNQSQYHSYYKTLPLNESAAPIVVAIGGDVGSSNIGAGVTSCLSKNSPDLMIIGGDAAYDDGLQSCWYSWDLYFDGFDEYNVQANRTIPVIVSVGNHDVGFNALSGANLDMEELPLYFHFLPQHFKKNETTGEDIMDVPDPLERKTSFYHLIGNMMHLSLDSGYVESYESQAAWMNNTLPSYDNYLKFGNYHVPIYPACLDVMDTPIEHLDISANNFVPVFENFGFKALFENHVHAFKKTFPLKDGKPAESGPIYYGDGNWGITPNDCIEKGELFNTTGVIEAASNMRHVWILKLNSTGYEIFPVNATGDQVYNSTYGNV